MREVSGTRPTGWSIRVSTGEIISLLRRHPRCRRAVVLTIAGVAGVKIVLDTRDEGVELLKGTVESLLAQGLTAHILDDAGLCTASAKPHGTVIASADGVDADDTILLVSGPVLFAAGSVRYLRQVADIPGRVVTRVLVPGLEADRVALWSASWVREHRLDLVDIARADVAFDRKWLSHDSPQARAWIRADELGIAARHEVSIDGKAWARSEGRRLRLRRAYGKIRRRVGVVKRQVSLWRQRRRMRSSLHTR